MRKHHYLCIVVSVLSLAGCGSKRRVFDLPIDVRTCVTVEHNAETNIIAEIMAPSFKSILTQFLCTDTSVLNDIQFWQSNSVVHVTCTILRIGRDVHGWTSDYVRLRSYGHTREYALAALQNDCPNGVSLSPEMALIKRSHRDVPIAWLKVARKGRASDTNGVAYILEDGPVVWTYTLFAPRPRASPICLVEARDKQEFDPSLASVMDEANREAHAVVEAMHLDGLGKCDYFWDEKKRILRFKHGIIWRSPAELNPDTNYD